MKIIDMRSEVKHKTFDDIKVGDTFCRSEKGVIFMRTQALVDRSSRTIANAVCLEDGKVSWFDNHTNVIPLNCECVIIDN